MINLYSILFYWVYFIVVNNSITYISVLTTFCLSYMYYVIKYDLKRVLKLWNIRHLLNILLIFV